MLGKRILGGIVTALADLSVDLIADFFPTLEMLTGRAIASLDKFDSAIECEPRHHFRMREMFAATAHFPDSFVRLVPFRLQEIHEPDLQTPIALSIFDAGRMSLV